MEPNEYDMRPSPDALLAELEPDPVEKIGRLKIFFGYAAGVGKTYAMLDEARELYRAGVDVVIGYIEPHTRPETTHLAEGLPRIPPKTISYRNMTLREFDLDAALTRKPQLVLVDELAHTNAEGVRNRKRYQDVEELLNAGIDVFTTVNVQHIESLNDIVENITKIKVQETVPDTIFERADKIKLVDVEPDELLRRFEAGKVYRPEQAERARRNFFVIENLRLLREIALRKAADRIGYNNQSSRTAEKMANTKLLVCFGPSPSSARCIRWTARAAEAFHAQWTALYVETQDSEYLSKEQQAVLRANMDLAAKLGAEIVTISGIDVAVSVAEYARLSGITNIVVGKSRNHNAFQKLFQTDFEDRLIELLPNIEVHIVPDLPARRVNGEHAQRSQREGVHITALDTVKSLGILLAATLLSLLLRRLHIGDQNIIMVYILSVLVISRATQGYLYGVVSSVLSVVLFNFFFVEPLYTFTALEPGYSVTFLIMLIVALVTSALTLRIKAEARLAVQKERRTEVLYEINRRLLSTRGLKNIVDLTNETLVTLFDRSVVFYTQIPQADQNGYALTAPDDVDDAVLHSPDEKAVAHWVFVNQKRAGSGTDTLMGANAFYMPLISQGRVLAVWGVSCKKKELDHNSRLFLRMIASQVAMALERQRLSDEQRNILLESEHEKMRGNLLRAISHDIRTPLAGISGASAAILENKNALSEETKEKLIANIQDESLWLIRMVENLLSVTRLDENSANLKKLPEAAEEVIADAVGRIQKRFPARAIAVSVPDDYLEVPMDGTLIAQVLINLLENAAKFSPDASQIEVALRKEGGNAVFEVADHGKGIPAEELSTLFSGMRTHAEPSADSSRGMGIGLSICKTIVSAHGGNISAENRPEGGAVFRFTLPLGE
ncbi:MAG TPA: sensor histidine kinase KdpD [Candidatus Cryosericum sp.]|nr:sensor histidine kinase KdpD [Candidatus Cryosericum sp.]